MKNTYITFTLQQHAFDPAPAAGVVYAAVTPRRRCYMHMTESLVVEINQTNAPFVLDRLLTGKQQVFNRLGARDVDTITYAELLPVNAADLAAISGHVGSPVSLADVENVVQRLFTFAAGASALGNTSTRTNLFINLANAQAVCAYFGRAIRDFFQQTSNDHFMQRLDTCITTFSGWNTGGCLKNLPIAPVTGLRRWVPVVPVGAAAAGARPTPSPTSLYVLINPTAAMEVYGGLDSSLYRDPPGGGTPQIFPSNGLNADFNTAEEDLVINAIDALK